MPSAPQAAAASIETGQPLMAKGGFSGRDPILDHAALTRQVRAGTVRFFAVGGMAGRPDVGAFSINDWVAGHCTVVPASAIGLGAATIDDCAAAR